MQAILKKLGIALGILILLYTFTNLTGLDKGISLLLSSTYSGWFDYFINNNGQELLRQVNLLNNGVDLNFQIAFVNIYDVASSTVKNVEIDLFIEFLFPLLMLLSLSIPFINKSNYKSSLIIILVGIFLFWIKNIIQIYDNYSYPDYVLVDLSFPFSQIVYLTNSLLEKIGSQLI